MTIKLLGSTIGRFYSLAQYRKQIYLQLIYTSIGTGTCYHHPLSTCGYCLLPGIIMLADVEKGGEK